MVTVGGVPYPHSSPASLMHPLAIDLQHADSMFVNRLETYRRIPH